MSNTQTYLVMEMRTGAVDGHYMERECAEQMVEHWQTSHPKGQWVILICDRELNQGRSTRLPRVNFAADKLQPERFTSCPLRGVGQTLLTLKEVTSDWMKMMYGEQE